MHEGGCICKITGCLSSLKDHPTLESGSTPDSCQAARNCTSSPSNFGETLMRQSSPRQACACPTDGATPVWDKRYAASGTAFLLATEMISKCRILTTIRSSTSPMRAPPAKLRVDDQVLARKEAWQRVQLVPSSWRLVLQQTAATWGPQLALHGVICVVVYDGSQKEPTTGSSGQHRIESYQLLAATYSPGTGSATTQADFAL